MNINNAAFANRDSMHTALNPRLGLSSRRQERIDEMRILRREREMKIQARENELIRDLNERKDIINEMEMNPDLRRSKLDALADQIERIYKDRAEREQALSDWEAQMQINEQERRIQEREEEAERAAEKRIPRKDADEVRRSDENNDIRGFAKAAVQKDTLRHMSRTRATLSMEATQLRHAIEFSGDTNPNEWRNRQLTRLNQSVAKLDTAVTARVANLYRQSTPGKTETEERRFFQPHHEDEESVSLPL
jgi:cell division FtsZ-interacting protein ZapD